jgi:tRNA (guanosine-2'-O-)-methyltransferase
MSFGIGIYHTKTKENLGTLWRSAYQCGASFIFTIGARYTPQSSDVYKTWKQIPCFHYKTFEEFQQHRPHAWQLVCVEQGYQSLQSFKHPKQAVYLLGAEDNGLPPAILLANPNGISLESVNQNSYNVAVAGSIIMYHRNFLQ